MRPSRPRRCCYLDQVEVERLLDASPELRALHARNMAAGWHLRPVRRPGLRIGSPMVIRFRWRIAVDDGWLQEETRLSYQLSVAP